ncbi:hypothetical protein M569_16330, partial [Genlisea aurea]
VDDKKKRYRLKWKKTKVNIDDHIHVPDIRPDDVQNPDKFVDDFHTKISMLPLDYSKPLWEVYILNLKTSDAGAVVIFKNHHSMGDGVSMTSLFLACSRTASDPDS